MSSRVIAICDICGAEQEIAMGLPMDSYEWAEQLKMEGWWPSADLREICPNHPRGRT